MAQFGQYGKYRFWEALPAFLVWSTFVLALLSSFFAPTFAVIFIIVFDLYWTLRVVYFLIHVIAAYIKYSRIIRVDWQQKVQGMKRAKDIWHIVMLPTYKEDISIIRAALDALRDSKYRKDRFLVVVGGEEGDQETFLRYQELLEKEYQDVFAHLLFTVHPRGLEGEIPGKGSNMKWMAEQMRKEVDARNIPYEDIIVHAFDVDTIAHEQYFARLTYMFLTVKDPLHASYQPLTLFSNNIWSANPAVRVASFGTTFWLLGEIVRPERMWTFSSHSMPWKMLVDVGYHEPDLVSEDSRIFMQGFLHYGGKYRVEPVFLPVHMDAVEGNGFVDSLVALYKQQRRWAWGVEHMAYMYGKFKEHTEIPFWLRAKYMVNHLEGMYTWSTAPLLIFVLGYLPFFVVGDAPNALIANAPFSLERMMQIATIGVFASGFMSFIFLPSRPEHTPRWTWLIMIAQWALLPVTFVLFGAFPAIDAQTRMALGKYLGFNVTKKKR